MAISQNLSGKLPQLANQEIRLERFVGLQTELLAKNQIDATGNFILTYTLKEQGVGFLISTDNKPFFVLLTGEDIAIQGNSLIDIDVLKVLKGKENQQFEQFAIEQPKREQAMNAWLYLKKMYQKETIFAAQKTPTQSISKEIFRIQKEENDYIASLPFSSYVKWFLPVRKQVSMTSTIAQYRPEEVQNTLDFYRQLDYSDSKLYHSGLFKEAIENHFLLIENSGKPLDEVYIDMNTSIDLMLPSLMKDQKKLNEVTDFLFDFLEKRSLFRASEYLAIKLLNDEGCLLESNLARQLETYRAMKKGNVAPDIIFEKSNFYTSSQAINNLSELSSAYTLVVFGASWCPKCAEELQELNSHYVKWKENGIEVVFIALEDNRKAFEEYAAKFSFVSYSDLKKWDSPIVNDYYVFGTPTLFLLNKKREIILRPHSVKQLAAWLDYNK